MQTLRFGWLGFLVSLLCLVSLACGAAVPPAAPTNTAVPPTPTLAVTVTPVPTWTPPPSATPDIAATQEIESRQALLQSYLEKGYITTTSGTFTEIPDFEQEWAQLDYYKWWHIPDQPSILNAFVFRAHFKWSAASRTPEVSGCGVVFGELSNGFHYAVFLDRGRILFLRDQWEMGKTRGSGRVNIAEPAEADFTLIVNWEKGYVEVNDQVTEYTFMDALAANGEFGLSLLSGTNKDYGTRCNITNAYLWVPKR